MDRIRINGSTSYDVIIEHGILDRVGNVLRDELGGERALIVTDSNVAALYLNTLADTLKAAGYDTVCLTLAPGEQSKSIDNYILLLNILAEHEFSSSDLIIALGGGMIGDLTGFAGSTFKRGMKCVQIPTSLLAAVDASVGGKTAVNTAIAKNQVGTIHNPSIVICDPDTMTTLSAADLQEGYAEIIKYGILTGTDILDSLRAAIAGGDYSDVIRRSVIIKRDIVEKDENDRSFRQYLNLGHLVGHAIEAHKGYSISHGQGVAEGLAIEARCAAMSGFSEMSTCLAITALLEEFGFDLSGTYSCTDLLPYLLRDKRLRNGCIQIIVPDRIGECTMRELDAGRLADYIESGL